MCVCVCVGGVVGWVCIWVYGCVWVCGCAACVLYVMSYSSINNTHKYNSRGKLFHSSSNIISQSASEVRHDSYKCTIPNKSLNAYST